MTEGATVVVANASRINGGAGRMSENLAAVGYTMAPATNRAGGTPQLDKTAIYIVADDEQAVAVASSLIPALGLRDVELQVVGVPAPTADGSMGAATVLVMMGNDIADKKLRDLQLAALGGAATAATAPPASSTSLADTDTAPSTSDAVAGSSTTAVPADG